MLARSNFRSRFISDVFTSVYREIAAIIDRENLQSFFGQPQSLNYQLEQYLRAHVPAEETAVVDAHRAQYEATAIPFGGGATSLGTSAASIIPQTGGAFEIHNYSDTTVTARIGSETFTGKTNDAAIRYVEHRIREIPIMNEKQKSFEKAWLEIGKFVGSLEPAKRALATEALARLKGSETGTNESADAFVPVKVWHFMNTFYQGHMHAWLANFIDESIDAYRAGSSISCTKGIKERVCVGLRTISAYDEKLKEIFSPAEAAQQVKVFLTSCDISKPQNAKVIAEGLKALGITKDSTPEAAKAKMREFMKNQISSFVGDPTSKASQIKEMLESKTSEINIMANLIEEFFDDMIKPHL